MKLRSYYFVLFVCFVPAFAPMAIGATAGKAGRLWLCGEWKICWSDLMGDGIAPKVKPSSTSSEMHPPLGKPPLGVSADMKVFRPFSVAQSIGIRVCYSGLSSVMELGFVAQATVWARNVKHRVVGGQWLVNCDRSRLSISVAEEA